MAYYIFTPHKLEEEKKLYTNLETRFNRLAGLFNYRDCFEGMACLDYAEILIGRMSYGSGDLSKNMDLCIETLNDLKRIVLRYERRLGVDELEILENGQTAGFKRLIDSANIEVSADFFSEFVQWIKAACNEEKKKPEEIMRSLLGADPETIRLLLEALDEDKIIEVNPKDRLKTEAQKIESYATF